MQSVRLLDQAGSRDSWLSVLVYFWFSYKTIFLSSVNQLSLIHFDNNFFGISGYVKLSRYIMGHRGIGGGVRENNSNRFML